MSPKERPILFSAPMIRAILAGAKTQTRRAVKPQPQGDDLHICTSAYDWQTCEDGFLHGLVAGDQGYVPLSFRCPNGVPGQKLWVRETFNGNAEVGYAYRATEPEMNGAPWRPSIFMPRAASRILLKVTDVRVERLQEITEDDAKAEGCAPAVHADGSVDCGTRKTTFRTLWESINGAGSWDANPWVWVVSFRQILPKGAA